MKLTEKQKLAANHKDGPCLVLAVPGSGKTTMLLERIKNLSNDIDPNKILNLTFSRSQAVDMKNRYLKESQRDKINTNFMTIHAFCYLVIRNFYKKHNLELKILEADDSYNKYNLIKEIYYKTNKRIMSDEEMKIFFSVVGYMRNSLSNLSYLKNSQLKNINLIYQSYEKFKKDNFYIDYDDMQTLALELINTYPNLLKSIRNKYKYIQLDEGQDTSILQFKIIEKISDPNNNLMIVADDDQSIYGFRAAEPSYLLNFRENYPNAKFISMDENHRSSGNIVEVCHKFIKQNKNRYDKNIFTRKDLGNKVHLANLSDSKEAYKYIIDHMDPKVSNAILYRNNISCLNLISFLIDDDRDFTINFPSYDYFNSKIIRDLENIIEFSNDFYNVDLFSEIYYKINTYLNKEEIKKLVYKPKNLDVFSYLEEIVDDEKSYNLANIKRKLIHLRKLPLDRKISYIYSYMGYGTYIDTFSKKYYELIYNKDLYIESLINFTKDLKSLDEFHEKIRKYEKMNQKLTSSNLILSTIHRSKGLEYDNVFIIDLVKNEFPMLREDENNLEEERRVFYVAMTRAKENLYLLSLKKRIGKNVQPSPFYLDIRNQ